MKKAILLLSGFLLLLAGCEDPVETKTYSVTVTAGENGTATADKTDATVGETVKVEATPDEGYEFTRWIVVGGKPGLESFTSASTTFEMPSADVALRAEFSKIIIPTYAISMNNDGNGEAAATIDNAKAYEAAADQVVTITATPNTGYVFSKWTVVSGGAVIASATSATTTFTMPASIVEIKAEFAKEIYTIGLSNNGNGTTAATIDGSPATQAAMGVEVTITATPNSGYRFSKWVVESGGITLGSTTSATTTFTMPASNVSVKAEFVAIPKYTIALSNNGNGTAAATVDGSPVTEVVEGKVVTITATPDTGYKFSKWVVESGGATLGSTTSATTTFTMPASNVSIKAEFESEAATKYTVSLSSNGNGTAAATIDGGSVTEAAEGQVVTITATPDAGYKFSGWVVESGGATLGSTTSATTTFTMPASNVSIKAEFVAIPKFTITLGNDGNGTAAATVDGGAATEAAEGQVVTITATANSGYKFSKWVVESGGATLGSTASATTTFTMPASNVSIKAEFEAESTVKYTVNLSSNGNGTAAATINGSPATEAAEGQVVTITATPDSEYKFSRWVVQSGSVTLLSSASATTTFTMPAENVTIRADFTFENSNIYPIILNYTGNGTVTAKVAGEVVTNIVEGQSVTITATPGNGYVFSSWTVVSGNVTLGNATAASNSFTMPASAVEITAVFRRASNVSVSTSTPPAGTRVENRENYTATSDMIPSQIQKENNTPITDQDECSHAHYLMFTDEVFQWVGWSKRYVIDVDGLNIDFNLNEVVKGVKGFELRSSGLPGYSFTNGAVYTSENGTDWTRQSTKSMSFSAGQTQYFSFEDPVDAKYIRLEITGMSSALYGRVSGFWIYK